RNDDVRTVSGDGRVRVRALQVALDLRHAGIGFLLPDNVAGLLVETEHEPLVRRVVLDGLDVAILARLDARLRVAADGRRDEDAIFPDDRARVAEAGDRRLPAHVF